MSQSNDDVISLSRQLNSAYGIPIMYSSNPTNGFVYDMFQNVLMTGYNLIPFYNMLYHREKSCQELVTEWQRIWKIEVNGQKNQQIVHITYSQGAIITAAALFQFWGHHLIGLNLIGIHDKITDKSRMHMVVMGSGYAFLDRDILPPDTHFVYDSGSFLSMGDLVETTVGGVDWNPANWPHQEKHTKIGHYPGIMYNILDVMGIGPHESMDFERYKVRNTYGWWYTHVGGPIFQLSSDHSIDGEKWWLHNMPGDIVDWWKDLGVLVYTTDDNPEPPYEHVRCEHYPYTLSVFSDANGSGGFGVGISISVNPVKSNIFNPKAALRTQLGH